MNVSGYIIANRSQTADVPIPTDPVDVPITLSESVRYDHYMYKPENEDSGVIYPAGGANLSETRAWAMQATNNTGEYWAEEGDDCVPCNCGGNGSLTDATFYPHADVLWNGRHYVYYYMDYFTPNGAVVVDVSSLPAGRYVLEVTHWFGYDDHTPETSVVRVDGNKRHIIKAGQHGAIEGVVLAEPTYYEGHHSGVYSVYRGYVVKARIRYAFTVSAGDTTKTFEFGAGKEVSFTDLWDCVFIQRLSGGQPEHEVWANCHVSFHIKVYKGG